jgi:GNAT superfamily N-acetyltransferase
MASDSIELREGYVPGAIGLIAGLHGSYYARVWGSGCGFEILVARELSDFVERYDPAVDLLLTAHLDNTMIGGLAMMGRNGDEIGARLRWFIVDPAYHGRGAGKALLQHALRWSKERGFPRVFLWTVDDLPESRHLYDKAGFHECERHPGTHYTLPQHHVKMELAL